MRTLFFAAFSALFVLFACTPSPTLSEQLADKSPAERHAILVEACHKEANRGGGTQRYSHAARMHDICDLLAQECSNTSTSSKGK